MLTVRYQTDREKARVAEIEQEQANNAARRGRHGGSRWRMRRVKKGRCRRISVTTCKGRHDRGFKEQHPELKAMNILALQPRGVYAASRVVWGRCVGVVGGAAGMLTPKRQKAARRAYQDKYPQVRLLRCLVMGGLLIT